MKTLKERVDEFNKDVLPFLLEKKYKRMLENAFSFFRGTYYTGFNVAAKS